MGVKRKPLDRQEPRRERKLTHYFGPAAQSGTARDDEAGENAYPRCQTKRKGPDHGGSRGSPTKRPMQDQGNAGEPNSHWGTSGPLATLLLLQLHPCGKNVLDGAGPVMQVVTCSTHRPLSLMEVSNLGPKHRPVQ